MIICFKIIFRNSPVSTRTWYLQSINSELISSPDRSVKRAQKQGLECGGGDTEKEDEEQGKMDEKLEENKKKNQFGK